jgi:hypothetical protein
MRWDEMSILLARTLSALRVRRLIREGRSLPNAHLLDVPCIEETTGRNIGYREVTPP